MKTIICFIILFLSFTSITFCQSVLNYQTGTGIVVEQGADMCADQVIINGVFSGGGTICGGTAYTLNLTAFIQGFYNSSLNTMVSDTIKVYLRSAVSPFAKVDSVKSVLTPNGTGSFIFLNVSNGVNYYIVLTHRNSIETWSITGNAFSSGILTYDFTPAANKAYGNNQFQVDNSPTKFAIYSGDVNQDGVIDGSDAAIIDNDVRNFVTGYVVSDVNGDAIVDGSDATIVDNNIRRFVSVIRP